MSILYFETDCFITPTSKVKLSIRKKEAANNTGEIFSCFQLSLSEASIL